MKIENYNSNKKNLFYNLLIDVDAGRHFDCQYSKNWIVDLEQLKVQFF